MKSLLAKIWRKLSFGKMLQLRIMRVLNDEFLIGVTGLFFNEKDEILLLKHSYRGTQWGLPGGYLKAKEHPTEGLEREIFEETGFTVSADRLFKLRTDRDTGRLDLCYIGTYLRGVFIPSAEVTEYAFYSPETLPEILRDHLLLIHEALNYKKSREVLLRNTMPS